MFDSLGNIVVFQIWTWFLLTWWPRRWVPSISLVRNIVPQSFSERLSWQINSSHIYHTQLLYSCGCFCRKITRVLLLWNRAVRSLASLELVEPICSNRKCLCSAGEISSVEMCSLHLNTKFPRPYTTSRWKFPAWEIWPRDSLGSRLNAQRTIW